MSRYTKKLRLTLTGWWRSMFGRLILSFLLILALAYAAFFGALNIYERHIEARFQLEAKQRAELIAGQIGQYFDQLQAQMLALSQAPDVQALNHEGEPGWLSYSILQSMNELFDNRVGLNSMQFVDRLIVLGTQPDAPVVSSVGTVQRDLFFNVFYTSPNYQEQDWLRLASEISGYRVLAPERFIDNSAYIKAGTPERLLIPIVLHRFNYDRYLIVALMDAQKLETHLLPELPGVKYHLSSLTHDAVLFGSASQDFAHQEASSVGNLVCESDHSITYLRRFSDLDLFFAMNLSNEALLAGLSDSRRLVLAILLFSAALCLWLAVTISSRFNNPIRQIREMLHDASFAPATQTSDLQALRENLGSLLKLQDTYRTTLQQQDSVLRELFYEHRVRNLYWQGPELFRLSVHFPYFLILTRVYLRRTKNDVLQAQKTKASHLLCDLIGQHISSIRPESITFQLDDDHFLSVVSHYGEAAAAAPQSVAQELERRLEPEEDFAYFDFAVGTPARQITDLHERYLAVARLIDSRELLTRTQIITAKSAAALATSFVLPQIQLNRLTAALSSASHDDIEKELNNIRQTNAQLHLQADTVRFLYETLLKSAFLELQRGQSGALDELNVSEPLAELKDCQSFAECHALCLAYFKRCIDCLQHAQTERDALLDQLLDYLHQHYHEDIYLDLLAEKTGYSASYLSAYFKRKMQVNLLDYLNAMRIDRADDLLQHSDLLIRDIATAVGIQNINTFNRLFRQYRGCTPSEWRARHRAKD